MKNNLVETENAKTTKVLNYTDYDPKYCLENLFTSDWFDTVYLKKYSLTDTEINHHITTDTINDNGISAVNKDRKTYVLFRDMINEYNCSLFYASNDYMRISNENVYAIYDSPYLYVSTPKKKYKFDVKSEILIYNDSLFVSENYIKSLFEPNPDSE
jgi:hypothetical protein